MTRSYSATVSLELIHGCQSIPCVEVGPGYAVCETEPDLSPGDSVAVVVTVAGREHRKPQAVRRLDGCRVEFLGETLSFFRR